MMNIDELILTKKFSELSISEKELVLTEMSEEAYNSLQYAIQIKRKEVIVLNPDLKSGLMADFKNRQASPKTSAWNRLLYFLFPAEKQFVFRPGVQLAFASLVLILGGAWLVQSGVLSSKNELVVAKVEEIPSYITENSLKKAEASEKSIAPDTNLTPSSLEQKALEPSILPIENKELASDADKAFDEVTIIDAEAVEMEDQIFSTNTLSAGFAVRSMDKDLPESSSSVTVADEPGLLDLLSATY